jgi:hypothetical protein
MAIVFLVDSSLMMFCQTLKKDIKYPMQGMVYQTAVIFMIALGICWWTQQTLTERRARGNRIRIPHLMVGWVRRTIQQLGQWMVDISYPIYARPAISHR